MLSLRSRAGGRFVESDEESLQSVDQGCQTHNQHHGGPT